ncbi:MAG TPA: SRPBCC family protein [Nitriliruptoraceae bacterium]|nr:SRPBCC family protein [Nitriliruptoraceae bacterium]
MDVSFECAAPADVAWAVSSDLSLWPRWGPSVVAVEPAEGTVVAGLEGRVRTPVGVWLPFVVDTIEPGRRWTWRVAGVPATGHRVDAATSSTSRLVIEVPLWAAAYAVVCHVGLRRLAGLVEQRHRDGS